jgi:hypothetical protein
MKLSLCIGSNKTFVCYSHTLKAPNQHWKVNTIWYDQIRVPF